MSEASVRKKRKTLYGEDLYSHPTKGLIYIETSCRGPGLDEDLYEAVPKGCNCEGTCDLSRCPCLKRSNSYSGECLLSILNVSSQPRCILDRELRGSVLNEPLNNPVIECNVECSCDSHCVNRLVQNGPRKGLETRDSGKGIGVFTTGSIQIGSFICEYAGELIGSNEAKKRLSIQTDLNASNYVLVMKEHATDDFSTTRCDSSGSFNGVVTVVDPTSVGNIGRYINHSCEPNIAIVPVRIDSVVPIAALFALREIFPGEELCYDYDSSPRSESSSPRSEPNVEDIVFDVGGKMKGKCSYENVQRKCLCKSKNCRGVLPSNKDLF